MGEGTGRGRWWNESGNAQRVVRVEEVQRASYIKIKHHDLESRGFPQIRTRGIGKGRYIIICGSRARH